MKARNHFVNSLLSASDRYYQLIKFNQHLNVLCRFFHLIFLKQSTHPNKHYFYSWFTTLLSESITMNIVLSILSGDFIKASKIQKKSFKLNSYKNL